MLAGCGGPKDLASSAKPKPGWINDRPLDGAYYIGVGSASKKSEPLEYASVAKKNALNDLASEISVTVKSESFLNTMQVNNYVQEEFNSTIATVANENLEGFEIVDTWEDANDYWILYRLSKAHHAAIIAEKKNKVMQSAHDFLIKGDEARSKGNIASAYDLYLHGLFELKEYWNDVNRWEDGTYLDNTLYSSMRSMISDVRFTANADQVVLSAENRYKQELVVTATIDGKPATGVPVSVSFDNGKFRNVQYFTSDQNGQIRVLVENANLKNAANNVSIQVDVMKMRPTDLDRMLVDGLTEKFSSTAQLIPIRAVLPVIAFQVKEQNLGQPLTSQRLADPLRRAFSENGCTFTEKINEADFVIYIDANTTEGGTSQGFYVAYLNINWSLKDKKGTVLLQNSESNVKGLQMNFSAAGLEAYKKGAQKMENEVSKKIIETIM
ncbi:MAG: hypothetical protein RL226_314 [Bacteroidota bacterium]